jgi:hypothetical protein
LWIVQLLAGQFPHQHLAAGAALAHEEEEIAAEGRVRKFV